MAGLILARDIEFPVYLFFAVMLLSLVVLEVVRRKWKESINALPCLLILLALGFGYLRLNQATQELQTNIATLGKASYARESRLMGEVATLPETYYDGFRFQIRKVENEYSGRRYELGGKIMARSWTSFPDDIHIGDRVLLSGKVRKIPAASLPGEPNMREFYGAQGIVGEIWISQSENIQVLPEPNRGLLDRYRDFAARLRLRLRDQMVASLSDSNQALLGAILLGERKGLPQELHEQLFFSGTMHITAVSGLHITLLIGIFWTA